MSDDNFCTTVRYNPADPIPRDHLADVYCVLGRLADAVSAWQRALDMAEGKADRLPNLASVQKKLKAVQQMLTSADKHQPISRPLRPPPETVRP